MRALITGYGGFAGSHLADHLLNATDWTLWGTVYHAEDDAGRHADRVTVRSVDLRDPVATRAVVRAARPDLVLHLAGQAFVPTAWEDPWGTFETNVRLQLNLLEALAADAESRPDRPPPRLVAVISNQVYGAVPEDALPTDESAPLAPDNPYATSKAAQDLVAAQYGRGGRVDVVRVRPFNHIGPRQDPRFVAASFARQVAEVEAGLRAPELHVGNLDARRDITDVRDITRGYRLAAERGRAGAVYNLGRGEAVRIGRLLDMLLERARVPITVTPDEARMRPSDIPITLCDAGRAARELGWKPEIPLEQTIDDILTDWRARVTARAGAEVPNS